MACSIVTKPSTVTLEDCICPICMSIIIQPVTMPCTHELCMPCFKQTVEEANLCCPMCRLRIATWARLSTKQNTLINEIRWRQIQNLFPDKVKRRLEGKEDDCDELETYHHPVINIAEPGEIRKEYEEQLKKLQEQRDMERSKEEEESAELIRKLREEEEVRQRELERLAEEQRTEDEELAKQLDEAEETSIIDEPEEIDPKASLTTPICAAGDKCNPVKTIDSFFNNQNGFHGALSTSDYVSGFDVTKNNTDSFSTSIKPMVGGNNFIRLSRLNHSSSVSEAPISFNSPTNDRNTYSSDNQFHQMSEERREFLKNQFEVMSTYSEKIKPVNPSAAATVTSCDISNKTTIPKIIHQDCDSTTDIESNITNSDCLSLQTSAENSNDSPILSLPQKTVGLFPPQLNGDSRTDIETSEHVCKKHSKPNKNLQTDANKCVTFDGEIVENVSERANTSKMSDKSSTKKSDSNRTLDDSDYESDQDVSDHSKTSKFKQLTEDTESDSNINNNAKVSKSKKVKTRHTTRTSKQEQILSPQRSIKDWFSAGSKAGCSVVQKIMKGSNIIPTKNTGRRKALKQAAITSKNKFRKTSIITQSRGKDRISKTRRNIRKVSRTLICPPGKSPLAPKDNCLNTDRVKTQKLKNTRKPQNEFNSGPSPAKCRRKQSAFSSDEEGENIESAGRGEITPVKQHKKLTVNKSSKSFSTRAKSPRKIKTMESNTSENEDMSMNVKTKRKLVKKKQKTSDTNFENFHNSGTMSESDVDNDLKLALKLQRQFDLEEKLSRQVNRSKGSESEYMFRNKSLYSPTK